VRSLNQPPNVDAPSHGLRKELGLRDLIPMQVLLVVGVTSVGLAARQGATHVAFWLLGIALMFLPAAGVIHYCVKIWPLEGGVYQWTKHAIGPFAGFISAWNFGVWTLLTVSPLGITTATSLSYALGARVAWMAESSVAITSLNIGLFAFILLVNVPGLRIGRWVAHFGTAVMLLVAALLTALLFVHPHPVGANPRVSSQPAFAVALPAVTMLSLNLFSKLAFISLTGLEQVAVFAGETRDASRTILRSAWIAAPVIALIYISMTGAMLTYTPAENIDLTGPIPQVLAAAFDTSGSGNAGLNLGLLLGRGVILALAVAMVAQFAVYIAELSRLPMVAAWDHLLPSWFRRLHPRYRTPTRSLAVMVILAVLLGVLASAGAGAQEAYQLMIVIGNFCYAIYYLLMFAVPLVASVRFGHRPGLILRIGCVCGISVTLLYMIFALVPVVDVKSTWLFALKVGLFTTIVNLAGAAIYWRGTRKATS
jgi:amino acid transporter